MAEEVGFEPTDVSVNGFQDRRLQPLGHSSLIYKFSISWILSQVFVLLSSSSERFFLIHNAVDIVLTKVPAKRPYLKNEI